MVKVIIVGIDEKTPNKLTVYHDWASYVNDGSVDSQIYKEDYFRWGKKNACLVNIKLFALSTTSGVLLRVTTMSSIEINQ